MRKRFQRLGGSFQLVVNSSADLDCVLDLDESQWAATSAPVESLNCDPEFLGFLDDDSNGRVRTDEVKRAIQWLLNCLKDRAGIDARSNVLKLDAIDPASSDGAALIVAAKRALQNLGLRDASAISLEQLRDRQKIISSGISNGDGVIPPDAVKDDAVSDFIKDLMESVGKKPDLAGKEGVDKEVLERFIKAAEDHLKWLEEAALEHGAKISKTMPFGPETHDLSKEFFAVKAKIDEYFACCKALSLAASDAARRFGPADGDDAKKVDPLDSASMKAFMEGAPLAEPRAALSLPLFKGVNPLWQEKLESFARKLLPKAAGSASDELSLAAWESLKSLMAPYEDWQGRKPSGMLDKIPFRKLSGYMETNLPDKLRALIEEDLAIAKEMQACDKLRRLILYQANFLEFANNFVALTSLFDPERTSMIQAGRLVMDGRHFTLATKVSDIEEHKKIAVKSDICIMYLELSTGCKTDLKTMRIAVGVTSGFMRNLYPGKNGIFFTPDGLVWDARVVDLLSQPVSFSEALRLPFYKLGEFMGRQADRFFSTKSKDLEDKASQLPVTPSAQAAAQQQQQQPSQRGAAFNGSMLLMGGGVGIAALGTSFALMAQALGNVSFTSIVSLLAAVMLIFGGPILIVSVYKLWKRNIAMFLEASGWALNEPLRMTRKMGLIFTHKPEMPLESLLLTKDLVNPFFKTLRLAKESRPKQGWRLTLLLLLLIALFAVWLWIARANCAWPFCK